MYYGRFTLSGKQKWVNLEIDVWTVAKIRLADERSKIERLRQMAAAVIPLARELRRCRRHESDGDGRRPLCLTAEIER